LRIPGQRLGKETRLLLEKETKELELNKLRLRDSPIVSMNTQTSVGQPLVIFITI